MKCCRRFVSRNSARQEAPSRCRSLAPEFQVAQNRLAWTAPASRSASYASCIAGTHESSLKLKIEIICLHFFQAWVPQTYKFCRTPMSARASLYFRIAAQLRHCKIELMEWLVSGWVSRQNKYSQTWSRVKSSFSVLFQFLARPFEPKLSWVEVWNSTVNLNEFLRRLLTRKFIVRTEKLGRPF